MVWHVHSRHAKTSHLTPHISPQVPRTSQPPYPPISALMATITASHGPTLPPKSPTKSTKSSKSNPKPSTDPNVLEVVFGSLLIKPWYPSFYPEELVGRKVERLMVCQWCFKYTVELLPFLKHLKCCSWRHGTPPGERIYTKDGYSLWEIDGEEHKVRTRFLSHFPLPFSPLEDGGFG